MKPWRERRERIAHSLRRMAEQEHLTHRLRAQEPHVHDLATFARDQKAINNLSQLFDQIVFDRRHKK